MARTRRSMDALAYGQLEALERDHWWIRGRPGARAQRARECPAPGGRAGVLALEAQEALFAAGEARPRTNLPWPLPRAAHELCYRAFAAELALARHVDLPAGHSIAALARAGA